MGIAMKKGVIKNERLKYSLVWLGLHLPRVLGDWFLRLHYTLARRELRSKVFRRCAGKDFETCLDALDDTQKEAFIRGQQIWRQELRRLGILKDSE